MNEKTENRLIALLDELMENGDFFISAIESNNYDFDCEEWKARVLLALDEERAKQ